MVNYIPTTETLIFVHFFLVAYYVYITRKAIEHSLDIYHLILLSTVALVPYFFVVFPEVFVAAARLIGVSFPFLILFGLLFTIIFVFIFHLLIKIYDQQNKTVLLIQEIGILNHKLDQTLSYVENNK